MGAEQTPGGFLDFYDEALPHVYGYLVRRCGTAAEAEDLTAETFLVAVDAVRRGEPRAAHLPWVMGVARHKLIDHWRRRSRQERRLHLLDDDPEPADPWDRELDALRARETLDQLGAHHRTVLALRYLDDLPVTEVASLLGRTVHATEALLVRAKAAFRHAYESEEATGA